MNNMSDRSRALLVLGLSASVGACTGFDSNRYNAPYETSEASISWEEAKTYAGLQRDTYQEAAASLQGWSLGSGATAVAIGGAGAGLGAAEVGGNVVTAVTTSLAAVLGLDELTKPAQRMKIFVTGRDAIQCSMDILGSTYFPPGRKADDDNNDQTGADPAVLGLAQSTTTLVESTGTQEESQTAGPPSQKVLWDSVDAFAEALDQSQNRLTAAAASRGFKENTGVARPEGAAPLSAVVPSTSPPPVPPLGGASLAALSADESFAAGRVYQQYKSVVDDVLSATKNVSVALENRKQANEKTPTRLVMAVNAIRAKVEKALADLLPSTDDIKKAANISISDTSSKDKETATETKSVVKEAMTKMAALEPSVDLLTSGAGKQGLSAQFEELRSKLFDTKIQVKGKDKDGKEVTLETLSTLQLADRTADLTSNLIEREVEECKVDFKKPEPPKKKEGES